MGFGALGHVAWIAMIGFLRQGVEGVANHYERGSGQKRIDECRIRIRNQQHVRFVDRGPSANRAGVESESFLEGALLQRAYGVADVLPDSGNVYEAEIENLRPMLFRKFQYTFWVHSLSFRQS